MGTSVFNTLESSTTHLLRIKRSNNMKVAGLLLLLLIGIAKGDGMDLKKPDWLDRLSYGAYFNPKRMNGKRMKMPDRMERYTYYRSDPEVIYSHSGEDENVIDPKLNYDPAW